MSKNNDIQEGILDAFKGKSDADKKATNIEQAIETLKASYTASSDVLLKNIEKILSSLDNVEKTSEVQKYEEKMKQIKKGIVAIKTYVLTAEAFKKDDIPSDITSWSGDMKDKYGNEFDKDLFAGLKAGDWNLQSKPDEFKQKAGKLRNPFFLTFMYVAKQIQATKGDSGQVTTDKLEAAIEDLGLSGSGVNKSLIMQAFASSGPAIMAFLKDPLSVIKKWRASPPGKDPQGEALTTIAREMWKKENKDVVENTLDSIEEYVKIADNRRPDVVKQIAENGLEKKTKYSISVSQDWFIPQLDGKTEININNQKANLTNRIDKFAQRVSALLNEPDGFMLDVFNRALNPNRADKTYEAFNAIWIAAQSIMNNRRMTEEEFKQQEVLQVLQNQNIPLAGLYMTFKNDRRTLANILKLELYKKLPPLVLQKAIEKAADMDTGALEENKRKTIKKLIHLIEQEIKNSNKQKLVNIPDHEVNNNTIRKQHG